MIARTEDQRSPDEIIEITVIASAAIFAGDREQMIQPSNQAELRIAGLPSELVDAAIDQIATDKESISDTAHPRSELADVGAGEIVVGRIGDECAVLRVGAREGDRG